MDAPCGSWVASLSADTEVVVLDIDATEDETHGAQQLSFFHGFYDHRIYHPLMVYDGESGQLITAILRPGNTHAARGAKGVLRRLIRRLKRRFPDIQVVVRVDADKQGPTEAGHLCLSLLQQSSQSGCVSRLPHSLPPCGL